MSFESRYHRFSTIRSMSFLSERLYGPLQVKHAIYLMISIMFVWRGLSTGNANAIAFAFVAAFIGLLSAVVGVKTLSFEAKLFMVFYSLFDSLFGSEPRSRRAKTRVGVAQKPRVSLGVVARVLLYPRIMVRVGRARVVIPSLAISVPGASVAAYVTATSGLSTAAKAVLMLIIILSVVVPHIAGLRHPSVKKRGGGDSGSA